MPIDGDKVENCCVRQGKIRKDLEPADAQGAQCFVVAVTGSDLGVVELAGPAGVVSEQNAHRWTASASPLTPAGLRRIFRYHRGLTGIDAARPHTLRHKWLRWLHQWRTRVVTGRDESTAMGDVSGVGFVLV
jgi:hypothetical protein